MNNTNHTPPTYFRWKTCLSSTLVKNEKIFIKCAQMRGAHLQCVNNHYAKFENKEMKTVGVTDYTNWAPSKHFYGGKTKFKTPKMNKKQDQTLLWTCVASEFLQCVNNHYAKFEYKGMKYVSITDYTQINIVSTPKVV